MRSCWRSCPPNNRRWRSRRASRRSTTASRNRARVLLPLRNLQFWIETNVLLALKDAPFDKRDAQLVPAAGSCADCPKRTGHNKLLFADDLGRQGDRCTDPACYQSKLAAHVAQVIAAKPELVQVSTAYGTQKEGSPVLPRNKYTAIRDDKPKSKEEATRPEFKVCKFATDAIITEGSDVGSIQKVCVNPECPVHHPKKATSAGTNDARWKAEQEKRRKEEAVANATGLRVLAAIGAAVPARLTKRELLFIAERLANLLDENRVSILARQFGIKKVKDNDSHAKLFAAFLRRADEGALGRIMVEAVILLTASRGNSAQVLREAATAYKVDTDAIAAKVKQEFAERKRPRRRRRLRRSRAGKTNKKPPRNPSTNSVRSLNHGLRILCLRPSSHPSLCFRPGGRPSFNPPDGHPPHRWISTRERAGLAVHNYNALLTQRQAQFIAVFSLRYSLGRVCQWPIALKMLRTWYETEIYTAGLLRAVLSERTVASLSAKDIWYLFQLTWITKDKGVATKDHWKRLKIYRTQAPFP